MRVSHDKFVFFFTVLEDCEQSLKVQADGKHLLGAAFILVQLGRVSEPLEPLGELLGLSERVVELIGSKHRPHGVHHLADLPELAVEAGAPGLGDLAHNGGGGGSDEVSPGPGAANITRPGGGTPLDLI